MPSPGNHDFSGYTIDAGRLILEQRLGAGSFGAVYRAQDILTGKVYAVKCLFDPDPANTTDEKYREFKDYFLTEFKLHDEVHYHPHVLSLHRKVCEDGHCFLVLDLCEGGDLFKTFCTPHFWKRPDRIKKTMRQLVGAVAYCHSRGVSHRDIKPANVLLSADRRECYLADFGLAYAGVESSTFRTGSECYLSPECIGDGYSTNPYNTRISDIWALGVILVEMAVGHRPWVKAHPSDSAYRTYLLDRAGYLRWALPLTSDAAALVARILEPDPKDRITLDGLQAEIWNVDRFTLNEDELACACPVAQEVYARFVKLIGVEVPSTPCARTPSLYPSNRSSLLSSSGVATPSDSLGASDSLGELLYPSCDPMEPACAAEPERVGVKEMFVW